MADFNWDSMPDAEQKPAGFSWDDMPTVQEAGNNTLVADKNNNDVGTLSAIGHGALRGATFNLSDRARAAYGSATGEGDYDDLLKDIREREKMIETQHPVASTLGKVAGGVGSVALGGELLGGLGLLGKGAGAGAEAAEAAGLGAEAAEGATAAEGGAQAAAETLANTAKAGKGLDVLKATGVGGALGGLSGLGEAEDWTNPLETAKTVGASALEGGIGAGMLSTAGKLLSPIGEAIMGTPYEKVIRRGLKAGYMGLEKDPATLLSSVEQNEGGTLLNLLNKNKTAISDKFNTLLDNSKTSFSKEDVNTILENSFLKVEKTSGNLHAEDAQKIKEAVNKVFGSDESISARKLDTVVKYLEKTIDKSDPSNFGLKQIALPIKDNLKTYLDQSLDKEFGSEIMGRLRSMSGFMDQIKRSVQIQRPGSEYLADVDKNKDAIHNLFDQIIKVEQGKAGSAGTSNELDTLFDRLSKVSEFNNTETPENIAGLRSSLADKADAYLASGQTTAQDLTSGQSAAGLSKKGFLSRTAIAVGEQARTAKEIAATPLAITKDVTNMVLQRSPSAAALANKLASVADSDTAQRAGNMLKKVLLEPSIDRRQALMFSLSQQPWFREAVGTHALGIAPNESHYDVKTGETR